MATRLAVPLCSRALVAIRARVVLAPGRSAVTEGRACWRASNSSIERLSKASDERVMSPGWAPLGPATSSPVDGSTMSPTALAATIAPTIRPDSWTSEAVPTPALMLVPGGPVLATVQPAPTPTVPCRTGPERAARAALRPCAACGLAGCPRWRSKTTAPMTIGRGGWSGSMGRPTLCSRRYRRTPVAASSPKTLPPVSSTAWTSWTAFSGTARSVSRVPGAPPGWKTPGRAPSRARTTVQPVAFFRSV